SRNNEESVEPRNNERGERPERVNRNERNVEKAPREESTAANGERQERRPRGERKERQRQQPEIAENKLTTEIVEAGIVATNVPLNTAEGQEAGTGEEQGARRRGRRGGRGRSERRNETESTSTEPLVQESSTLSIDSAVPMNNQEPVIVVIPAREAVAPVVAVAAPPIVETLPVAQEAAPVVAEVAPVIVESAPPVAPAPVEVVESIEIVAAPPVVVTPEAVDLEKTLADSGLMMVQTTAAIVAQPEAPLKLGRPRKAKPLLADQADAEPLVSVETIK
ncbi:MAG TPA: hypothetical protein VLA64_00820, partial [Azonexus sp.]|nr:hypothetical protein [Azonexus sp.]